MSPLNVYPVGFGLMSLTAFPDTKFTQQQFDAVLDAAFAAAGSKPLFLNAGEFYGVPDRHENIEKLGVYFKTHPEHADRTVLSVKGGINDQWMPDSSPERLKSTFDAIAKYLQPLYDARKSMAKTLDYFTLARVGETPIEDTLALLKEFQAKGAFSKLCMSEVSGPTVDRAAKVAQVDMIEVEYSLFSRDPESDGVFDSAKRLGIPVVAYSPLGKGVLAGLDPSKLSENDIRRHFDRFSPEIFEQNKALVAKLADFAKTKGTTTAQVAIGWLVAVSGSTIAGNTYPQIVPIPGTRRAEQATENLTPAKLSESDVLEIKKILDSVDIKGGRYNAQMDTMLK